MNGDGTGNLKILLQGRSGINQDIFAALRCALIEGAARELWRHQQRTTASKYWISRIISVAISRLCFRGSRAESAISVERIGMPVATEIETRLNGTGQRPFLFVAP